MDTVTIEINRLCLRSRHGVMAQERIVGNDFEVSVSLVYPAADAVRTDRLDATLNYAEVCDVIKSIMDRPSALLEHVCGRLRDALIKRFPLISSGRIRVAKLNPPIEATQLESVAVELAWE